MSATVAALPPRNENGFVVGRYCVDPADIERTICVLPDAAHRAALWAEWQELTRIVQQEVGPVAACWLSGSFFTDKQTPGDIDALYVIHHKVLEDVDPASHGAQIVDIMSNFKVKDVLGLRVDAPILPWWPRPGVRKGNNADRLERYLQQRGYWDDLWSRVRDNAHPKEDSLIRRGYLEVIVDGYQHP
ncbi:DUF6932 family protein [Intrasporangium sp. YIM S08009]|uniref:DUF6932 family protein n=1 Tax=Intrasporangium zincisolvens TaxID=3080018 RepID=UPI002B05C1A1|nr:hypothetical protein [Intrasporangium sp. YIM S08009]